MQRADIVSRSSRCREGESAGQVILYEPAAHALVANIFFGSVLRSKKGLTKKIRPISSLRSNQRSQQDLGSSSPARDPGDNSNLNVQSAKIDDDDFSIRGQAGRRPFTHQSQSFRANSNSSITSHIPQNDQTSDTSGPGVHVQMSTPQVPRTPERGSTLPESFQRRELTEPGPMVLSDDESSDEEMLSDISADDEPSQRSAWSSQGQQCSSQSTVHSNRHEDDSKLHGASMDSVLHSSQRLSRLTMQPESPSSSLEPTKGTPGSQKRRRALTNLEPEAEERASHRNL